MLVANTNRTLKNQECENIIKYKQTNKYVK